MQHQKPAAIQREPMGIDGLWALFLSCLLLVATLGLSWLAVLWQVWRLAVTTPTDVKAQDWIVVLGKRLLGAAVTLEYAQRLRRASELFAEQPGSKIMILGGFTSEGPFSEAQQGANFLQQRGIPADAMQIEDVSFHTLENLRNARELLGSNLDKPITLITSRYHLARSHALAAGFGLPHQLCAAEERLEIRPAVIWRLCVEAFFLHWYWVGRYWSTVMRNRKNLARIS